MGESGSVTIQPSIGQRFKAWWEGYELPLEPAPGADDEGPGKGRSEAAVAEESGLEEGPSEEGESQPTALHVFRERFKAWWEGYEYARASPPETDSAPAEESAGDADQSDEPPSEPQGRTEPWTAARIKIAERLWGAGFTSPGGAGHILQLVKPCALNPKMSFIQLGAGLGGPTRAISEAFGIWVNGLEPSEMLVEAAMAEATMAGMAKKAPVATCDPESVELRTRNFDCVFAKEAFFTVVNKKRLFKTIAKSLKKGGQLLFTDYVLAETDHMGPETQNWIAHEPVRPEMWSATQVREQLEKHKLTIRIVEDMSEEMCQLVLRSWRDALANLKPGHIGPELGDALVAEAEMWARRIEVLESGEVRLYRFHALK
jgi:cyclopropane fatty-acyl-phospholipid synthase-like methyltransferase